MDVYSVCDYIIRRVGQSGIPLNVLKLHKLLYYAQAWHLALQGEHLFQGKFQAWPQGPIHREIYERFAPSASLYSELSERDLSPDFSVTELPVEKRLYLDRVLRAYARYGEPELQRMIAQEAPWEEATSHGEERCEREIDEEHIRRYFTVRYLADWREGYPRPTVACENVDVACNSDASADGTWLPVGSRSS